MSTSAMVSKYQGDHTLDELAILFITSPEHVEDPNDGATLIITTKGAYFWAVLLSEWVFRVSDDPEWFMFEFRKALTKHRKLLRHQYASITTEPTQDSAFIVFKEVARALNVDPDELIRRTNTAYQSLLEKGLIQDPVKKRLALILLAVFGLCPTGFSSTTEKGGAYVKEVHAITYSYVDKKDESGKETKKVEIRLLEIIKILQPKMLEAYDEIVMGDGDEGPTENK